LGRLVGGGCGVDSPGSGWRPLAGCCECGDEPSSSGATELVKSEYEMTRSYKALVYTYKSTQSYNPKVQQ
jgi:hypothetical protein